MNTPDRDQPVLGRTDDGAVVFCAPGDPDVELIAALREEFDRRDPTPPQAVIDGGRFSDLRDQVRIPQLNSGFVREFLAKQQDDQQRIYMFVHMTVADFDSEADLITYAQTQPSAWMGCTCASDPNCYCGGEGVYPAWLHDPETVVRNDES